MLQNTNVRVNAVAPGSTNTPLVPASMLQFAGRKDIFCDPIGEYITSSLNAQVGTYRLSDIANTLLFLASGERNTAA